MLAIVVRSAVAGVHRDVDQRSRRARAAAPGRRAAHRAPPSKRAAARPSRSVLVPQTSTPRGVASATPKTKSSSGLAARAAISNDDRLARVEVIALVAGGVEQAHGVDLGGAASPSAAPRSSTVPSATTAGSGSARSRSSFSARCSRPSSSATSCAVGVDHPARLADQLAQPAVVEPEHAVAEALDQVERVADEEQRPARRRAAPRSGAGSGGRTPRRPPPAPRRRAARPDRCGWRPRSRGARTCRRSSS